ncbi:MAG: hypothetical protein ACXVGC_12745, partial [Mycobacteriaceae bacterium]
MTLAPAVHTHGHAVNAVLVGGVLVQDVFGVGDVFGDEVLVGVVGGGHEVEQGGDVVAVGCAVGQGYSGPRHGLHISQHSPLPRPHPGQPPGGRGGSGSAWRWRP